MRAAICDDEQACLEAEEKLIKEAFMQKDINCGIDLYKTPDELLASDIKYDMIFLDVEMKGMNGIETADKIHSKNKNTLIFFVTNYEGYMDEALNKHAFRFWTKPINPQRLLYGIESAIKEIESVREYLDVTVDKKPIRILMKDIIFAYAKNKETEIITIDEEIKVREPFKYICARLSKEYFCSSHASYIINMDYVVRYTSSEVICRYKDKYYTAYMSKRRYSLFGKRFIEWMGSSI